MHIMRIAAVDDERHVLERFERMILKHKDMELCGLFERGEDLLTFLGENSIDVVFLDIEMPEVNGLELSARILDLYEEIDIIFVTAFNQYAVDAFEVQALDYILKPLTEERLNKTIQRLIKNKGSVKQQEKPFIQCFGDFEVFLDKEAMVWKNSKAKEIFAFLVQKRGVPVSWEKIADAVWPDYNSEKAQTNFHATTYLLRKRLAEAGLSGIIENGRGNYKIVTEKVNCDLYQLEALIESDLPRDNEGDNMLEKLARRGYLEASGYAWAQPTAAELDAFCAKLLKEINNKS